MPLASGWKVWIRARFSKIATPKVERALSRGLPTAALILFYGQCSSCHNCFSGTALRASYFSLAGHRNRAHSQRCMGTCRWFHIRFLQRGGLQISNVASKTRPPLPSRRSFSLIIVPAISMGDKRARPTSRDSLILGVPIAITNLLAFAVPARNSPRDHHRFAPSCTGCCSRPSDQLPAPELNKTRNSKNAENNASTVPHHVHFPIGG